MKHLVAFFCQINKAIQTKASRVDVAYQAEVAKVVHILYRERRIRGYQYNFASISIWLKYNNTHSVIQQIRLISRPSVRLFSSTRKLPLRGRGLTLTLISTNQGIISQRLAQARNIGGEILCWID